MNTIMHRSFLCVCLFLFSKTVFATMPVIDVAALAQLGNQLAELKTQTQSMQQTLQTLSGDQYQWSNTQDLMKQLQHAMQMPSEIMNDGDQLQHTFQKAYPGYQALPDFQKHYQTNVNTAQQTFCGVLESLHLQAQHLQSENQHLDFLQHQVQHAQGQTQAIQASSQITSEIVSQQQLLRQAVMAQTNAQTAYYATQLQNDASRHAEFVSVIQAGATKIPAYGSSGQQLDSPDF